MKMSRRYLVINDENIRLRKNHNRSKSIDEETLERYGVITSHLRKQGTPIPTNDLWIAASAMQYGFKVLTTDKHYLKVSQIITEYFQAS